MIHFVSSCRWYKIRIQLHLFAYSYPVVPSTVCWKSYSFCFEWSQHSCQNAIDHQYIFFFFSGLSCSIDLYVCPMSVLYCLDYCCFLASFTIGTSKSSYFLLLFQNRFAILQPLQFQINFTVSLSVSPKKVM